MLTMGGTPIEGSNLTYTLEDGTLTISGTGNMPNWIVDDTPWSGSSITTVIIESGVTSIGDYAFFNCYDITSVTIPSTVRSIGESAFAQL